MNTRIALSLLLLLGGPGLLLAQCDRQIVVDEYNNNYLSSAFDVSDLNWTGNLETCQEGTISNTVQNKFLQRINYFRRLVGVEDQVVFSNSLNQKCQKAAFMQEKNSSLSHCTNGSCSDWDCNHPNAIEASQSSNLAWGNWNYFNPIDLYMEDPGQYNTPVGHRRWLLHSQAKTFGNGITPNRNALWVFGNRNNPEVYNQFIAYPPAGYIPRSLVYPRWSFGIPGANFTQATVSMEDENGTALALTIVHQTNTGYGDRTIVWEPQGVEINSLFDKSYTVTISNISGAPQSSYTYTTTIIPPVFPPNCPGNTLWNPSTCACEEDNNEISGPIESGTYTSEGELMATGDIAAGDTVIFQAGTQVSLQAGFSAAAGSTFTATIVENATAPSEIESRQQLETAGRAGVSEFAPLEITSNVENKLPTEAIQLTLQPNPARTYVQLTLDIPRQQAITAQVFDMQGRLLQTVVQEQLLPQGQFTQEVNVQHLAKGIYYIRIQSATGQLTKRFVVTD